MRDFTRKARQYGLSNRGQSTVEYVLLLIVVIGLALLLMSRVYKPISRYAQAYFGDYLQCILETGELPSMGSDDTALQDQGCNIQYKSFTVADGRPLAKPATKDGSDNSSSDKSKNKAKEDSSSSSKQRATDGGSGGGNGGGRFASSSSSNGRGNKPDSNQSSAAGETGEDSSIQSASSSKGVQTITYNRGGKRFQVEMPASFYQGELEKQHKETTPAKVLGKIDESMRAGQKKKFSVQTANRSIAAVEEENSWAIGDWMRYLFIILILVAILVFLLFQAVQISKSREKS